MLYLTLRIHIDKVRGLLSGCRAQPISSVLVKANRRQVKEIAQVRYYALLQELPVTMLF